MGCAVSSSSSARIYRQMRYVRIIFLKTALSLCECAFNCSRILRLSLIVLVKGPVGNLTKLRICGGNWHKGAYFFQNLVCFSSVTEAKELST